MARQTGVTASTPANLIVDAGAVFVNYGEVSERLLGATRGGNTFTVTQETRNIEADGVPGPINAMVRIINVECQMEVNLLEYSKENLQLAFPGSSITDYPDTPGKTHDSIRRSRNIEAADFLTNIALVGTVMGSGEPVICLLYNALQMDNVGMQMQDDDETVTKLTFHGHFDLNDLDTEPWEVRYPVIA